MRTPLIGSKMHRQTLVSGIQVYQLYIHTRVKYIKHVLLTVMFTLLGQVTE